MKKYILVFSLILMGLTSQSQVLISLLLGDKLNSDALEFGLEGGMNYSTISGFETNKFSSNFNLGFYFDIRMKNEWYFHTGVSVKSSYGLDKLTETDLAFLQPDEEVFTSGSYEQKIKSFYIPLLINYKLPHHFYAELGPQLSWARKGYVEYYFESDAEEINRKVYNSDMIQRIDVGAMGGFGYRLRKGTGMTLGIRYYHGFIDIYKDRTGTKSSSINLKMNIPIGAGPKE